mmetsp:Transcript_2389/g.5066  ORF Transcript_2389/g.5066 Transcript_2389/m.5066 type:complete len:354 (+) Transcript_2389:168-1229(+)
MRNGLLEHVGQDGEQVVHHLHLQHGGASVRDVVLHAQDVCVGAVCVEDRLHGEQVYEGVSVGPEVRQSHLDRLRVPQRLRHLVYLIRLHGRGLQEVAVLAYDVFALVLGGVLEGLVHVHQREATSVGARAGQCDAQRQVLHSRSEAAQPVPAQEHVLDLLLVDGGHGLGHDVDDAPLAGLEELVQPLVPAGLRILRRHLQLRRRSALIGSLLSHEFVVLGTFEEEREDTRQQKSPRPTLREARLDRHLSLDSHLLRSRILQDRRDAVNCHTIRQDVVVEVANISSGTLLGPLYLPFSLALCCRCCWVNSSGLPHVLIQPTALLQEAGERVSRLLVLDEEIAAGRQSLGIEDIL